MTGSKYIAAWLFACAAAVFLMALVGAVTRLTESGLSIVEWKPVAGALPPMNEADWDHAFTLYQQSPQYKKVNLGMNLDDFKKIYFWEWLHRLWGRLIGLLFFVPFAIFWLKGKVPQEARGRLAGILFLGFLQGVLGWFMVKSGLVDRPAVSHYRLAAHLALAFIIFSALLRMGLHFTYRPEATSQRFHRLQLLSRAALAVAGLTMVWGAFVAGLRAGMVYNDSFPLMGQHLWPAEMLSVQPPWKAFFEDPATVQFTHRVLALLTFLSISGIALYGLSLSPPQRLKKILLFLLAMAFLQPALGITTLLTHVNIVVATLHQAGALTLLALLIALLYDMKKERKNAGQ
jgi:cytochrome c oxidase assembly protein subunit 15